MTRRPDIPVSELSVTIRTRVRRPETFAPGRIFSGWGPDLGR
jgi:hypothetical protein